MSEVVRLYRYKSLLAGQRAVPADEIMAALEISRATLKRDIAKLRDQLHVPISFDREQGGYVLEQGHTDSELPGLWFNQQEILALVTLQHLLSQLEPGLLGARLKPLQNRLGQLMEQHGLNSQSMADRVRILHAGKRLVAPQAFEAVATATLARKRLNVQHFNRQNGKTVQREVSPQRIVHYRDNWYLDAWCHLRDDLRSFSIDAISGVEVMNTPAKDVLPKTIDDLLGAGYGIFGGHPTAWATLKFAPERARWVRGEKWHPQQESWEEADGSYVLSVPYSDDREIVGDIMRFGADVQVVQPPELRRRIHLAALELATRYV